MFINWMRMIRLTASCCIRIISCCCSSGSSSSSSSSNGSGKMLPKFQSPHGMQQSLFLLNNLKYSPGGTSGLIGQFVIPTFSSSSSLSSCNHLLVWFPGAYIPIYKIEFSRNINYLHVSNHLACAHSSFGYFSMSSSVLILDDLNAELNKQHVPTISPPKTSKSRNSDKDRNYNRKQRTSY
mmetsp:Transcript_38473/g.49782  ORF Transcript_38473/g.49782 Transcript_38473/m.49782 type:complete len:181 (+) Transcript_38473:326-868(+)